MKTRHIISALLFSLLVSCPTFADRQLDRAEILQIFQRLTNQPRKTWIPTGTIEAIHEEYRAQKQPIQTKSSVKLMRQSGNIKTTRINEN